MEIINEESITLPLTVAVHTLGCKLNFSESATLSRMLQEEGFQIVKKNADVDIINTCAVTETAEKKCRQLINKLTTQNPDTLILLTGCYASLEQVKGVKKTVKRVFPGRNKLEIAQWLKQWMLFFPQNIPSPVIRKDDEFFGAHSLHERTRSLLKIQDGCNYRCTYCTVPAARGNSRSGDFIDILDTARTIARAGVKEIVLTGVNIGDYRTDEGFTLYHLLKALHHTPDLKRLRLSSVEPNLLTYDIIDMAAESNLILPHFHIPLQSGSSAVLSKMRRKYDCRFFAKKIEYIRRKMPDACIATDVIVGFPGENDAEFENSYRFISDLSIDMLHVFPYSKRPGTAAARMYNNIPEEVINERIEQMLVLGGKKKNDFYNRQQGKTFHVLVENKKEGEYLSGFTENYIRVRVPYQERLINQIIPVRLTDRDRDGTYVCQDDTIYI
jgi:threonylcarbamoyladenosine tRNA methylthiotransferase MtaB